MAVAFLIVDLRFLMKRGAQLPPAQNWTGLAL
jgi:hypothetical protein